MNLESINSSLFDKILSGVEHIGFFVHNKKTLLDNRLGSAF